MCRNGVYEGGQLDEQTVFLSFAHAVLSSKKLKSKRLGSECVSGDALASFMIYIWPSLPLQKTATTTTQLIYDNNAYHCSFTINTPFPCN